MSSRRAFTLIELLVVISIIALLASVVLASLSTARDKGRLAAAKQFSANVHHVAADSAVGWWPFEEGTGSTTIDASRNNGTGTLTNGPIWTSSNTPFNQGYSLSFDGLNDYVSVNDRTDLKYLGGDMTLAAWINPDVTENDGSHVFSKPWNGNGEYNYRFTFNANGTLNLIVLGATAASITSTGIAQKGKWSFVVATMDSAKNLKIYIDGALAGSGTHGIVSWTPPSPDNGLALCIGTLYPYGEGWGGVSNQAFDGFIDDPRIYAKTLSASEVSAMYAAGLPKHMAAASR